MSPRYVFIVAVERESGVNGKRDDIIEAIHEQLPADVSVEHDASLSTNTEYVLEWEFVGTDLTRGKREWKGLRA